MKGRGRERKMVKPIKKGIKIRELGKTEAIYAHLLPSNSRNINAWIICCAVFLYVIDLLTLNLPEMEK
jgi:hypothetical protein